VSLNRFFFVRYRISSDPSSFVILSDFIGSKVDFLVCGSSLFSWAWSRSDFIRLKVGLACNRSFVLRVDGSRIVGSSIVD